MTYDLYDEMHLFKYFLSFSTHLYLGILVVEYFWGDLGEKIFLLWLRSQPFLCHHLYENM